MIADLGLLAGYEITPLLKSQNYFVRKLQDSSFYFSPSLIYSVSKNFNWIAGLQTLGCSSGNEFGMSQTAVSLIWHAFALTPHRNETFKLSTDPEFVDQHTYLGTSRYFDVSECSPVALSLLPDSFLACWY